MLAPVEDGQEGPCLQLARLVVILASRQQRTPRSAGRGEVELEVAQSTVRQTDLRLIMFEEVDFAVEAGTAVCRYFKSRTELLDCPAKHKLSFISRGLEV